MRILPVLDLINGVAVHAVAGHRSTYRPLVPLSDPLVVARTYRDRVGHSDVYLADLDAIAGAEPAWGQYASLQAEGCTLWLDAGVRDRERVATLIAAGVSRVIVGLETVAGPAALADILSAFAGRVVFSLDLRNGRPLGAVQWPRHEARAIADDVIRLGARSVLVLDLARVGVATGVGTESLLADLHAAHPEVELLAGGGVRGPEDLSRLERAGVSLALVASALHDGTLG